VSKLAERLVQNVLGASETTTGSALSAIVAAAVVPGVMVGSRPHHTMKGFRGFGVEGSGFRV
jgi:hypothetical protein